MARGKGKIKAWFTRNGIHVPIYEDSARTKAPKIKGMKASKRTPIDRYHDYRKQLRERDDVTDAEYEKLDQLRKEANEYKKSLPSSETTTIDMGSIKSAQKRGQFKKRRKFKM